MPKGKNKGKVVVTNSCKKNRVTDNVKQWKWPSLLFLFFSHSSLRCGTFSVSCIVPWKWVGWGFFVYSVSMFSRENRQVGLLTQYKWIPFHHNIYKTGVISFGCWLFLIFSVNKRQILLWLHSTYSMHLNFPQAFLFGEFFKSVWQVLNSFLAAAQYCIWLSD